MNPRRLVCATSIVGLLWMAGPLWGQSAMRGVDSLPPTIPLFPIQDVVLFPNNSRLFQIYEPRYRAMVADALKGDRIIGMVLLRPGYEADYEGRPPVYSIGCAGVITNAELLPDGRYMVVLRGLVKFRIDSEDQSRAYRLARVESMPEEATDEENAALRQRRPRLMALLAASISPGTEPPPSPLSDEDLVNAMAQWLDLTSNDRQELLEQRGALARSDALINLLTTKVAPPR
jgi:Lon protease-like protein